MSQILDRVRLDRSGTRPRGEATTVSLLFTLLAVAVTALVVYGAYFGLITALILRSAFFSLVATGGLLAIGLAANRAWVRWLCYGLAAFALVPGYHLWASYLDIIMRGAMATPLDLPIFVGLMVVVFVLVRLALGWALVVLMAAALLYAWFGYLIPGQYGHGGYDLRRLASTLMLSTEGVYGLPMGVAVEYIFLFALLGNLLMKIGTGEVFVDIARGLTGRMRGGPGLSAALSSALLGTINGSAVANVVTTGTFTIPLMKRVGYSANLAGAIEAAASSAGQILPPVMGAAAFLMAEIIGVPYAQIALAALIPGLLYVLALMVAVWLEAGRLGLERDTEAGLALLWATLSKRGYLLLPLFGLIGFLIAGYTPTRAAVLCLVLGLLISPWRRDTRIGLVGLAIVCRDTLIAVMPIVAAVAAAGAVIGVLNLTGLGLMLSGLIVDVGGQSLWGDPAPHRGGVVRAGDGAAHLGSIPVARGAGGAGTDAARDGADRGAYVHLLLRPRFGDHAARRARGLRGGEHLGWGRQQDGDRGGAARLRQAPRTVPLRDDAGASDGRDGRGDRSGRGSRHDWHRRPDGGLRRMVRPDDKLARAGGACGCVAPRRLAGAGQLRRRGHARRPWCRSRRPRASGVPPGEAGCRLLFNRQ